MLRRIGRILLLGVGMLSVALGFLGLFLPVLPTTPFLLLAAFCFARSSDRFYRWLIENPLFGETIRGYREGRGVPRRVKAVALLSLWLTVGLSVGFLIPILWVRLLILAVAAAVTLHILRLKTAEAVRSSARHARATERPACEPD